MRKSILTVAILGIATTILVAQKAEVVKLPEIQKLMETPADQVQVINFWATWCAPCVKELPLFEKLNAQNRPDVKVTLISMDMDLDPNPEKVYKFIERKKIQSRVLLLDESDPNAWISKLDKNWSGALPATIVINTKTGKRIFVGKELGEGELDKLIAEVQ